MLSIVALFAVSVGMMYPLQVIQEFLSSLTGMMACAAFALVLTAWLRFAKG